MTQILKYVKLSTLKEEGGRSEKGLKLKNINNRKMEVYMSMLGENSDRTRMYSSFIGILSEHRSKLQSYRDSKHPTSRENFYDTLEQKFRANLRPCHTI